MKIINDSLWLDNEKLTVRFPPLKKNIATEVAVIGAGITGLTTAYLLAQAGKKVIVLEQDILVRNTTTAYSTSFLTYITDAKNIKTEEAVKLAISFIEKIIQENNLDCDFTRCPLFVIDKQNQQVMAEYSANAKFNPVKYLLGLIPVLEKLGVQFYENTKALSFTGENPVLIKTPEAEIKADFVVLAKNSHAGKKYPLATDETYVLAADLPHHKIKTGLYIDNDYPYNYWRVDENKIILGGLDHSTEIIVEPEEKYKNLEILLKKIVGVDYQITHHWSGQVVNSADGLPYIGKSLTNDHQFLSAGHAGDGLTLGTLSAIINSDIILGKKNIYEKIFSPKRLNLLSRLIQQGWNVFNNFFHHQDKILNFNSSALENDSGIVAIINNKKIAIYKDQQGKIHKFSPYCPHLKCTMHWNNVAKTWDCPCHGSRFTALGELKHGPAKKNIDEI